jgi:hypothetical protein
MAQHVGAEHFVERGGKIIAVDVVDALVKVEDADAVDQNVEGTIGIHRDADCVFVGLLGDGVTFDHRQPGHFFTQPVAFVSIMFQHSESRAFGAKRVDDGPPDTRSGTHDQGALAVQPIGHGWGSTSSGSSGSSGV